MPIGQISKGYTTESGLQVSDETKYVLVVDAVASAHPVWLIFDRMLVSKNDEEKEGIHLDAVDSMFRG